MRAGLIDGIRRRVMCKIGGVVHAWLAMPTAIAGVAGFQCLEEFFPVWPWGWAKVESTEVVDLGLQGAAGDYPDAQIHLPHKKPRKSKRNPGPQLGASKNRGHGTIPDLNFVPEPPWSRKARTPPTNAKPGWATCCKKWRSTSTSRRWPPRSTRPCRVLAGRAVAVRRSRPS